jgi:hypothetical protein
VKVILIANNPEASVPSSGFDLYVHFNSAIHWGKTPEEKSIIGVRVNKEVKKHRSFRHTMDGELKPFVLSQPIEKIVAVGWQQDVQLIDPCIPIIALETVPNYPAGHSATSGFAAIHHYLSLGDKVTLSGFDLSKASYYNKTKLHLPDWEMEKVTEMIEAGIVDRY